MNLKDKTCLVTGGNRGIGKAIVKKLIELNAKVIFPIHPRTYSAIKKNNLISYLNDLEIINPVGFLDMVILEKNSSLIITDSGGVQKEAYVHKTPCVTIRDETEWVELIEYGWNRLANGEDYKEMLEIFNYQLCPDVRNKLINETLNIYGDGFSANLIVDKIFEFFNEKWLVIVVI